MTLRFSHRTGLLLAALWGTTLVLPPVAQAHLGPPFPVITDQPVPGYKVTVLTNPDTTQAVAYVVLERTKGAPGPAIAAVDLWIQPLDRHTARSSYQGAREFSRDTERFYVQPNFDAVGEWYLGANLHFANGVTYRFVTNVDATPPGIGRFGVLLFALPMLAFGTLFVLVVSRRKRAKSRRPKPHCVSSSGSAVPRGSSTMRSNETPSDK